MVHLYEAESKRQLPHIERIVEFIPRQLLMEIKKLWQF